MEIIVASSNVFRRELSTYLLSEAGYTVYEAVDSTMLVNCLNNVHAGLILLDANLIGSDSSDLNQYFHQHHTVPIMLLTNGKNYALTVESDDNLSWPYEAEDLLLHVEALIHNSPND